MAFSSRARRGALLRRQRLDVRGLRRDGAGLGRDASSLNLPGGPRLDAVPHAEPASDTAPGGRDGDPARARSVHTGGSGRAGSLAANPRASRHRRGRGRGDRLGLPARAGESDRGRDGNSSLRAAMEARSATTRALAAGLDIAFSSVSAEGLDAGWLGRRWDEAVIADLLRLQETRGIHPCGEGGEFETLVLDGPFFRRRVEILRAERDWRGTSGVWRVREARLAAKA